MYHLIHSTISFRLASAQDYAYIFTGKQYDCIVLLCILIMNSKSAHQLRGIPVLLESEWRSVGRSVPLTRIFASHIRLKVSSTALHYAILLLYAEQVKCVLD